MLLSTPYAITDIFYVLPESKFLYHQKEHFNLQMKILNFMPKIHFSPALCVYEYIGGKGCIQMYLSPFSYL